MKHLTYPFLFFLSFCTLAQEVTVSEVTLSEMGEISFSFQVSVVASQREVYDVLVYSSKDDYQSPLDIQLGSIKPNVSYPVSFDAIEKIGAFEGSLQFKLKAKASFFPVQIIMEKPTLWAGKIFNLNWSDYHESGWYNVDLYKDGELKENLVSNHRGTTFESKLPKKMDRGAYELMVTPSNEANLKSDALPIRIKKPLNPFVIVGTLAVAGSGVFLISAAKPSDSSGLPNSPGPPDN